MSSSDIRRSEIERQDAALGNPALYRITATHAIDGYAKNLCRDRDTGEERLWTLADIIDHAPMLARLNAQGWNIFTTPIESADMIHILIDDVRPTLAEAGFVPNLIQRSSPASTQAIFALPFRHPREIYLDAFNRLNKEHGDPQISGLRHPFRLAGYTNRKPKYQGSQGFPFVQLEQTRPAGHVCSKLLAYIDSLAAERQGPLSGNNVPGIPRPSGAAVQPEDAAMGRDYYMARSLIAGGKMGTGLRRKFEEESEHLQDVKKGISGYDLDPERYVSRTLDNAEKAVVAARAKQSPARPPRLRPGFHRTPARPTASTAPKP